jgi:hypothetical protein
MPDMDRSKPHFSYLSPPEAGVVHIHFRGSFDGRPVNWNARIMTLAHAYSMCAQRSCADKPSGLRQFIEVGEACNTHRDLAVGLNVRCIDEQVIRKAIIMIRQYRRLQEGRHEFGEPWSPDGCT